MRWQKKCCWLFDEKIMCRASDARRIRIFFVVLNYSGAGGTRLNISQIIFHVS